MGVCVSSAYVTHDLDTGHLRKTHCNLIQAVNGNQIMGSCVILGKLLKPCTKKHFEEMESMIMWKVQTILKLAGFLFSLSTLLIISILICKMSPIQLDYTKDYRPLVLYIGYKNDYRFGNKYFYWLELI